MTPVEADALDDNELTSLLKLLEAEQARVHLMMNVVIPIGVALAYEQDLDRLLERILDDAMNLCAADGGTLHLLGKDDQLKPAIVRNRANGAIGRSDPAVDHAGSSVMRSSGVATMASSLGELINLPEVEAHHAPEARSTPGTKSCLAVPLRSNNGRVIGVVELSDARDPDGQICPFEPGIQQVIECLCKLASVALESYLQQQKLKDQVRELTIQIDDSKKKQQVSAIVETNYFKALQSRARQLRAEAASA